MFRSRVSSRRLEASPAPGCNVAAPRCSRSRIPYRRLARGYRSYPCRRPGSFLHPHRAALRIAWGASRRSPYNHRKISIVWDLCCAPGRWSYYLRYPLRHFLCPAAFHSQPNRKTLQNKALNPTKRGAKGIFVLQSPTWLVDRLRAQYCGFWVEPGRDKLITAISRVGAQSQRRRRGLGGANPAPPPISYTCLPQRSRPPRSASLKIRAKLDQS